MNLFKDAYEWLKGEASELVANKSDFMSGAEEANFVSLFNDNTRVYHDLYFIDTATQRKMMPHLQGRGFFIPIKMPKFMEKVWPKETKAFRTLLTSYATGVDGIQARSVEVTTVTNGNEFSDFEVFTKQTGATKEVTLQFPAELAGQFLRAYCTKWLDGMYDPHSGRMTLYGANLKGEMANVTMEGLAFTTDPKEEDVLWAAYLGNMFCKTSPEDVNNWKRGEHGHFEVSLQFSCSMVANNQSILNLCQEKLDDLNLVRRTITANAPVSETVGGGMPVFDPLASFG